MRQSTLTPPGARRSSEPAPAATEAPTTGARNGVGRARAPNGAVTPLLEGKAAIPKLRRGVVQRPRIRRALDRSDDAALTLVAAPAGYGKTTAVRSWCASRDVETAWVTLDVGDNDPIRLWWYLASALNQVRVGVAEGALGRLSSSPHQVERAVDEFLNGVRLLGRELVIVLDDLDTVTSTESLALIDYAVEHLPSNAHLVLLTRADPALRIARLRAAGELVEVRADELAFTRDEAGELLRALGRLPVGSEEIATIVERTEGWPVALVLAWLWLCKVEDPVRAVRAFGGDNRFVADYLSGEVLAGLNDDRKSFLCATAVLGTCTAEMCDDVLERNDSAARLQEAERANLFVSSLEGSDWFRIHSLFADYAKVRLASAEPGTAALIHQRAARWLDSHGMAVEATEHAAEAGDYELMADLVLRQHLPLIRAGAGRTVLRWVQTLPEDRLVEFPELAAAAAASAMLIGGCRLVQRRLLALAERGLESRPEPIRSYVNTAVALVHASTIDRGVAQAVEDGRRAVALAETDTDVLLTGALAACGRALFFAGALDEAWELSVRALEQPAIEQDVPSLVIAYSTLSLVAVEREHLATARGHAETAKAAVKRIGASRSWLGASASAALGSVLAAEGGLVEAEHELAAAESFFADEVGTLHHTWILVLLARLRMRRGRLADAETTLRSAFESLNELSDSGAIPELAGALSDELEAADERASEGELLERPSDAELAVLGLLTTDLSMREIGERLFVSQNTIRSHTRAIYHKLRVHNRADAIARAAGLGLLE